MEINYCNIDWSFVLVTTLLSAIIIYVIGKVCYECGKTDEALRRDKLQE